MKYSIGVGITLRVPVLSFFRQHPALSTVHSSAYNHCKTYRCTALASAPLYTFWALDALWRICCLIHNYRLAVIFKGRIRAKRAEMTRVAWTISTESRGRLQTAGKGPLFHLSTHCSAVWGPLTASSETLWLDLKDSSINLIESLIDFDNWLSVSHPSRTNTRWMQHLKLAFFCFSTVLIQSLRFFTVGQSK